MKKTLFTLLVLPGFLAAQNITNTLGTNGTYIVENVSNASVFRASNTTVPQVFIGDWASGFSLPAGNINLLFNNSTAATSFSTNIVVGNGNTSGAMPTLQFFYTPGSLGQAAPLTDVGSTSTLGIIGFGGYLNSGWRSNAAKISVAVNDTLSGDYMNTKMTFSTQNRNGTARSMTFNSGGNLIVDGSTTSKAIVLTSANYTLTASDQTIVCTAGGIQIFLPSVADVPVGKTYTIKKGFSSNLTSIFLVADSGQEIDGTSGGLNLGFSTNYYYIQVQSDGAKWWVIARGTGL